MLPESWGWTLLDSGLYPTKTDMPPAPDDLLKVIRCNCSTDCSSARCSCQKHGLKCSLACGQCRGTACINASAFVTDDEENIDEEFVLLISMHTPLGRTNHHLYSKKQQQLDRTKIENFKAQGYFQCPWYCS